MLKYLTGKYISGSETVIFGTNGFYLQRGTLAKLYSTIQGKRHHNFFKLLSFGSMYKAFGFLKGFEKV
jgi:hypothetical protein